MTPQEPELVAKIDNGSKDVADYFSLGKIYSDRGDYHRLFALYDRAVQSLTPAERALIVHHKGVILNQLGRSEEASFCFERALQFLSEEKESEIALAVKGMSHCDLSLEMSGDAKADQYARLALEELKRLIAQFPEHENRDSVYEYIGDLHFRFRQLDAAMEAYQKGLEASTDDVDRISRLVRIAGIYWEKRNRKKAEEIFQLAIDIAKEGVGLTQIYYYMGRMYFEVRFKSKAMDAFEKALAYLPRDPFLKHNSKYIADIHWHLGALTYDRNDYERAIHYLTRVLNHIADDHPYYCDAHMTLGHCFFNVGYWEKARDHYNGVLFAPRATQEEIAMADECLREIGGEMVV